MRNKDWIYIAVLIVLAILIPRIMLFYIICGIIDFHRSKNFDIANWKRYFLGNGLLTWILSPFNLLIDLFCHKNLGVYQLEDLPFECQSEIKQLMDIADHKPEIISELSKMMEEKRRGMLFFKWYGKNINTSVPIPEFHQEFKYINTIGVSVFNKQQETSVHYGPLRITLRVLYNLVPVRNDEIYIKAADKMHVWHDNPLFIFDDTLVHQSVNRSDNLRYVMFVDILRPSNHLGGLKGLLTAVRTVMLSFNRVFYKNWDMLK
jgi:beta-hydroxylase